MGSVPERCWNSRSLRQWAAFETRISVRVMREERLLMVGYGASASTVGATRAGRAAALAALKVLGSRQPVPAR